MESEGLLSFLLSQQQANGGFSTFVSKDNFATSTALLTNFATSLILACLYSLRDQPLAATIINRGVDFLLSERSNFWSWNYWQKNSSEKTLLPYPDDWDDTACALIALSLYRPKVITPKAFAHITKLLIATEIKPGGPYYTWILDKQTDVSKDIDPVVNANINYFLKLHDIRVNSLQTYLENIITSQQYSSLYYHTPESILYFLSRISSESHSQQISNSLLQRQNNQGLWENDLLTALAVSTLVRCNISLAYFSQAINHLSNLAETNLWKSYPLYIERSKNKTLYAGSPALTTAFVLEALSLVHHSPDTQETKAQSSPTTELHKNIVSVVKKRLCIFSEKENYEIATFINRMLSKDTKKQITLLPYFFSQSLTSNQKIDLKLTFNLGTANLYGWIAYTIYDNILDETSTIGLLPLANICLRELTTIYKTILLPANFKLFDQIMDTMEKANVWEYSNCHFKNHQIINKDHLLTYPDNLLSDKSFPHALGPIAILLSHGYSIDSEAVTSLLSFFTYYLQARQLNDDAHDWQEDLQKGFLNSVSFSLLYSYFKTNLTISHVDLEVNISELRSYFWQIYIHTITRQIDSYTTKASLALKKLRSDNIINNSTYLEELLQPLQRAGSEVRKESSNITSFFTAFRS